MEGNGIGSFTRQVSTWFFSSIVLTAILGISSAQADFNLTVTDPSGGAVASYKWLLEEDTTFAVSPGDQAKDTLSNSLQGSYAPVITTGESLAGAGVLIPTDITKRYHITVTAFGGTGDGYAISGASVSGATPVVVEVEALPFPVALISILVFPDKFKVNGVADLPQEVPQLNPTIPDGMGGTLPNPNYNPNFDPTKFTIQLYEAGGRYGITGGLVSRDAFGNPLGTTYLPGGGGIVDVIGGGVGTLVPDAKGELTIKNLSAGKYGIQVVPPPGEGWQQTSTLEGGRTVDAWVLANEAPHFTEFGPPGPHVFMGFVQPTDKYTSGEVLAGANVVSGTIVNNHMARPPTVEFFKGNDFPSCWVALQPFGVVSEAEYIQPCDGTSSFNIPNVPDGTYELVVFDSNLNVLLATQLVSVGPTFPAGSGVLGKVSVFNWFARFEATVYNDLNQNGLRDPGEPPIQEQAINIRFRDGTIYQSFPTDSTGQVPFDEVFPFFHWLVAEVDFVTLKATGVTYVVDAGGGDAVTKEIPADNGWFFPTRDVLYPQLQPFINPLTFNFWSTTIPGPVLTMGMQIFLGQTNVMEFGKAAYAPGENGGISGIVYYAITRAEDDPRLAAGEEWEPGIPRVPVILYADGGPAGIGAPDGIIDDLDMSGGITLADVDFYPFGNFPGPEDTDGGVIGVFDYGDAVQVSSTDSWDDNLPTGCVSSDFPNTPFVDHAGNPLLEKTTDCYDGFRMFNQIRPAVFDGGYAFATAIVRDGTGTPVFTGGATVPDETASLAIGGYIVQSHTPAGYKTIKEEDRNVDFGNSYQSAEPLLLPAVCVGADHLIPEFMSFQTDSTGAVLAGITAPVNAPFFIDIATPVNRPLCDTKQVFLTDGQNAAADFFMFTDVPIAAHVSGTALDDLSNEFDKNSPNFGEKFGMKWIPVTFRDWTGRQIAKTYTDEFGRYNALVPSTYTVNIASPSGVQPQMYQACINDGTPDLITFEVDQFYRPNYSTTCYSMQFMPGTTSYLDTPVVPIAAFAGPDQFPVDCELPTFEPEIARVEGPTIFSGPYAPGVALVGSAAAVRTIVLTSTGILNVPNPEFTGLPGSLNMIPRDYGFGVAQGTAMLGTTPLTITSWTDASITAVIPVGTPTGQLTVTHANGISSRLGVTVTTTTQNVINVTPPTGLSDNKIQLAIDTAPEGSLILVEPGEYFEMVVIDRALKLQGWGARSTIISAIRVPSIKLTDWRQKVRAKIEAVTPARIVTLAPGQVTDPTAGPLGQFAFISDEAPAILVMADKDGLWAAMGDSRIDGITMKSADQGGGLLVNAYAHNLSISNNRIAGNAGNFSGGIRFGNALYTVTPVTGSINNDVSVHHNHIVKNGAGALGAGGGISIHAGTKNYSITDNFICGNFTSANGAGIGHLGFSKNGLIADNLIVFNQSFNQGKDPDGGGIFISGTAPNTGLGEGSGSVSILRNLIEGNHAGAGLGGGIRLANINGTDIFPGAPGFEIYNPSTIVIENNMIVGNVAGNAGGGIAINDAVNVDITNNTIAHNMSTSTTGLNFQGGTPTQSFLEQGAGIRSDVHSIAIQAKLDQAAAAGNAAAVQTFANPALDNNIIWQNRSYLWLASGSNGKPSLEPALLPTYSDLFVKNTGLLMEPMNGILTNAAGYDVSNTAGDPLFIRAFGNGNRDVALDLVEQTIPNTAPALDEGGNFIDVRYGPLSLIRNYHILSSSPAVNMADNTLPVVNDIDGLLTRVDGFIDKGADEVNVGDADSDGIKDDLDNCTLVQNVNQIDTNGDGYGNRCDADFDNNGAVNITDFSMFSAAFNSAVGDANYNPDIDLDSNGAINITDFSILSLLFNKPPGPSALAP